MGVPVSQRQGGPHNKKASLLSGEASQKDTRGLKSKNLKETKEQKEKMEADFKQSIEGLSIVGTAANNKKR